MGQRFGLSKSKLMAFWQCPRRLWLSVHRPDCVPADETNDAVLAIGTDVGVVARLGWPEGILIAPDGPLEAALSQTRAALAARRPLFEATVQQDGVLVRADILVPRPRGKAFDLVEVKSSTSVKDYQLADIAIQAQVFAGAGVSVKRRVLHYINSAFIYPGDQCYREIRPDGTENSLFAAEDVTAVVQPLEAEVPGWIVEARRTLAGAMPEMTDSCDDPYPCPYQAFCHADAPEYPLSCLPRIGAGAIEVLSGAGYTDVRDIPEGVLSNPTQEWVRQVTRAGRFDRRPGARAALRALDYPRYYLDFETIQFAVPIWRGTRPYEQLPFQWSCHREERSGTVSHTEFLDLSGADPTRPFALALIEALGAKGPICVYNQGFEGRVIRELATRHADLAAPLTALLARLVDLLPLTRAHYYHPAMKGSWSIKAVLPTIAPDLDYAGLAEVQDGGGAQEAYREAIDPATAPERKKVLDEALRRYCGRDTQALVRLASFLGGG
ncbi:DUF2779 domain-containing protein [Acidiferrobacter sp.]|uniref:DUF2779 domain-containing protein n=1 Tax=Acidiferrobacter sp. TaxID=1872107 RepID=UPI002636C88F|nr:DUF2779 domain-containing protein [Acidiferrobacter sp.]